MKAKRWWVLALLLIFAGPARGEIALEVVTVGFRGDGAMRYVYRGGAFAPLGVRLTLSDEAARQVVVRIEQYDRDGDIVFTEKVVSLTPDLRGLAPVHWLYFVPNPETQVGSRGLSLQILDEDGQAIDVVYDGRRTRRPTLPDMPEVLAEDCTVVLSVSSAAAGRILKISDFERVDDSPFQKAVRIAQITPEMLPDHWHGLEMVDVMVWEGPDPSGVTENQQRAVLDWVRYGGRLLLAAGETADALAKSALGDHLPVAVSGVKPQKVLPAALPDASWRERDVSSDEYRCPRPIQVAQCTLRPGAAALVRSRAGTQTYLARTSLQRGSVTWLSLTVHDLFQEPREDELLQLRDFFGQVLELRRKGGQAPEAALSFGVEFKDLFDEMHEFINFQTATTVYLLVAILFVVFYGLAATWGSWFVLKTRGLLKHCWSLFFVVVAAASLFSLAAVQVVQGLGNKLHQLSIVDSTVDTYSALAHCYFGVKTSSYVQDLDLWLPQGSRPSDGPQRSFCYLRPLSPKIGTMMSQESRYADTKRYQLQTTRALLEDIPVRATLKQTEGLWQGQMDGQVHADITLRGRGLVGESIFGDGSVIANDLGHDLHDCYLFVADIDPHRLAGSRNRSVFVYPLGTLPDGEAVDVVQRVDLLGGMDRKIEERMLQTYHKGWAQGLWRTVTGLPGRFEQDPVRNVAGYQRAIMLLSTFAEYEPELESTFGYGTQTTLLQTNCRWLDRSRDIRREQLLLVGFAHDAGPVSLFSRRGTDEFRYQVPTKAVTVYRIQIPAKRG